MIGRKIGEAAAEVSLDYYLKGLLPSTHPKDYSIP